MLAPYSSPNHPLACPRLMQEGFVSLARGNPNMNSLVALGCSASFSVGAASALWPSGGGFDASFLEEPVMLLAFVLLGRAMEARAKVRRQQCKVARRAYLCRVPSLLAHTEAPCLASDVPPYFSQVTAASDLKSLAQLIPATSRLVLDPGAVPGAKPPAAGGAGVSSVEYVQVATSTIRPGDIIRVLPGGGGSMTGGGLITVRWSWGLDFWGCIIEVIEAIWGCFIEAIEAKDIKANVIFAHALIEAPLTTHWQVRRCRWTARWSRGAAPWTSRR